MFVYVRVIVCPNMSKSTAISHPSGMGWHCKIRNIILA